ncbi:TPA: TATA element modulatory factor 1, variant 2 [Trebouxia sp. C0005]
MQELEAQLESAISHSKRQVAAAQRQASEAIQKAEAAAAKGGAEAVAGSVERETAMNKNLAGLRVDLEAAEASWAKKEATLRREVGRLQDQIHTLEAEKAELAVSASEATKPLLRQLESMAAQAAEQQRGTQESELNLTRRLRQAESAQAAATEAERQSFSQAQRAEVAVGLAKQALLKAQAELQQNRTKLHLEQQKTAELQERYIAMDRQLQATLASANTAKTEHSRHQLTLQAQTEALQQQLKDLRSEHEQLHDRLKSSDSQLTSLAGPVSKPVGRPSVLNGVRGLLQRLHGSQTVQTQLPISTPSLVIGQRQGGAETPKSVDCQSSASSHMPDASSSAFAAEVAGSSKQEGDEWDELLRSMSLGKRPGGKNRPATAGHIANLERRLLTSEAAERRVHTELMKACERAEAAERSAAQSRQLEEQMQEQHQRYNTALELLGEKNEKVDQLEEDIAEMKQIFHEQISVMANQLNATNKA